MLASTAYSGTIHDSPWSGVKGARNTNTNTDTDNNDDNEGGGAMGVDGISPFEKRLNESRTGASRDLADPFQGLHPSAAATTSASLPPTAPTAPPTRLSVQQQRRELSELESSCRMTAIRSAVHLWMWTDLLFGFVWALYGLLLLLLCWRPSSPSSSPSPSRVSVSAVQPPAPVLLIALVLTVAALLLSRFVATSLSLWTVASTSTSTSTNSNTAVCGFCGCRRSRCGLVVSAYIAALLSLTYATTLGIVAAAGRGAVVHYFQQHHHYHYHYHYLTSNTILSTSAQFHGLLTVLLVLAVAECIQWRVYQEYRRYLLRKDAFELLHPPAPPAAAQDRHRNRHRRQQRRRQPWWWQSSGVPEDTLTRHLLLDDDDDEDDDDDDDNANIRNDNPADISFTGQPRWALSSPFRSGGGGGRRRRRRRRRRRNGDTGRWWGFQWKHQDSIDGGHRDDSDGDVRDDGSVDFAEVQEEWASRTEEDPFWWSRPEDHGSGNTGNDTSWADDKDKGKGKGNDKNDEEKGQRDGTSSSNPK